MLWAALSSSLPVCVFVYVHPLLPLFLPHPALSYLIMLTLMPAPVSLGPSSKQQTMHHTVVSKTHTAYQTTRSPILQFSMCLLPFSRFSIAWTRIVPEGFAGSPVNMKGINWYRNLLQKLLEAGIKPAVTM